jgi:hypothetical protein
MLSASRGSNSKVSDCYIEGSISLKTRSKAFLANCTIRFCTFDTQNQDRLQLQIERLQQQPAILCDSAAQADVRAVRIVNYDTAFSATHKDSKIHGISCQIHGCSDAAIELMHRASAKFFNCHFAAPPLSGAAHLLKNSGASLLMQSCSIFMSSPSDQEVDNNRMLVSEAKAVTSFIGCNISAVSSHLNGGSVTKITGSLIGPPLFSANSGAAFRVNDSGTKLFALGKLHATCNKYL